MSDQEEKKETGLAARPSRDRPYNQGDGSPGGRPRGGGPPRRDGGGGGRPGGPGRPNRRFFRGKVCPFTVDKINFIDYKDIELLRKYVTDAGKIVPRRVTGVSSKHQRMLTQAIKRARHMALLPFKSR
jgi:small subunit ribosomal protein S18